MNNPSNSKKYKAGWVKDAHGLKGELYVRLAAKTADWLDSFREFWLIKSGVTHHFEVVRAKPHKDGLIVSTNEIKDRTPAETFRGAEFYIPEDYLAAAPGEAVFLKQILGFEVMNGATKLGTITSFSNNGAQDLLNVQTGRSEILIPFVDAFIREIDHQGRRIIMELPEGLGDEEE